MTADKQPKTKEPTRIRDARGREVTQLDPMELQLLRRYDAVDAETLRTIAAEVGSGLEEKARKFLPTLVVGASVIAVILIIQIVETLRSGDLHVLFSARNIALANVWFFVMVLWTRAKQGRFGRIRRIMLEHHRCPHCGYDLRGLAADEADGATLCPECGSAWRCEAAG